MEPTGEPASSSSAGATLRATGPACQSYHPTRAKGGSSLRLGGDAGDRPNPFSPLTQSYEGPPTQHRGSYMPLAPLPCSSLSRSQDCPHQEYLLTRLALLAALTTNMLSDKVGRKKF